jgi:4-hydroxybenzoate polyprenyltransferase
MRSGSGFTLQRRRPSADLRRVRRYLACLRYREILILQGPPLLGAVFAIEKKTPAVLAPLAVLAAASALLVAHVFVLNDWAGLRADLNDPNKAANVFAARGVTRPEIGRLAVGLLAASLLLFAILGAQPLALAAAIAGLSVLYSLPLAPAKGMPLLGSLLHLIGGALHFLLGYVAFHPIDERALALAAFCGLVFAAGHLNQEVRDGDGDRRNGITTNAVVFGKTPTFLAGLAVFTLAYFELFVLAARGLIPSVLEVAAVLYPLHLYWSVQTLFRGLTFESIRRLQARYRALFAIIGAAMLAARLLAL